MTRRVLIDINVLLDVLARREPFVNDAARIWSVAETGQIRGLVCADSFTTVYYLLRQASNARTALRGMRLMHGVFEIVAVDDQIIGQAID